MRSPRGWASAAIVIGLVISPIVVCVGLFQHAAIGLASSAGDCADGCAKKHAQQAATADGLIYGGLIGGAVLVVGGIAAKRANRRRTSEGDLSPELPRARIASDPRRSA